MEFSNLDSVIVNPQDFQPPERKDTGVEVKFGKAPMPMTSEMERVSDAFDIERKKHELALLKIKQEAEIQAVK